VSEFALSPIALPDETGAPGRLSNLARHALSLLLVAAAVVFAEAFQSLLQTHGLTLFFVLPVVISATSFGWGPSITATIAGVLAYDFFFTEPKFSLAIASPADICDAALLFVIAGIVSAVAAQGRSRALAARRAAEQADALRALAHAVVERRPEAEVAAAAAAALQRSFQAAAVIFGEREGRLSLIAKAGVPRLGEADEAAARAAAASHVPVRAGAYPADTAGFDFWPVAASEGRNLVIGVDATAANRPAGSEALIELIAAYLSAAMNVRQPG
jgi:K+-sensing histidine kinase KdpD